MEDSLGDFCAERDGLSEYASTVKVLFGVFEFMRFVITLMQTAYHIEPYGFMCWRVPKMRYLVRSNPRGYFP